MPRSDAKIRIASFFSGAGGMDWGFHEEGFAVDFATDICDVFCDTLRMNMPKSTQVTPGDIRVLPLTSLPDNIDFVIGGPPCQSFSASGRRAGGAAGQLDERGTLFESYARIIDYLQPEGFLFENVRGLLGTNGGKDWQAVLTEFQSLGYTVSHRILDACDYGVAQQRERLFLIGTKSATPFLFPKPTHGPDSVEGVDHVSAEQAIADVNHRECLKKLALTSGKYAHLLPRVPPGENYLHFTEKRGYPEPIFAYRSRFSDFLYKADPDRPTKTLIASPGKYTGPFHWENRVFSVGEYMRLQGFPDTYKFCGSRREIIQQIGNSVSPMIARQLAKAVKSQVFRKRCQVDLLASDEKLSFDKRKGTRAQKTKERHKSLAAAADAAPKFRLRDYACQVLPHERLTGDPNVQATVRGNAVQLTVRADRSRRKFASMRLAFHALDCRPAQSCLFPEMAEDSITMNVRLFGEGPHAIQTMWNAVDDFVIRSSSYHSLFELYGHFTEPHPTFSIVSFSSFSSHPVASFAKYISDFDKVSVYAPRDHLTNHFGESFGRANFPDLVSQLRAWRFDIRCHETNIAIPKDRYMVAYPFTLPSRRQMNFSAH